MKRYESWGRIHKYRHRIESIAWRSDDLRLDHFDAPVLPYGLGRSYGDSCLNDGGILLDVTPLNRFIAFDREKGILRCEAGVTLAEILKLIVWQGWFLPVTPGTKFVTVGGAIANDVHGKNHACAGTFGCHVRQFELLRSNGERLLCSPTQNADWFRATIGGLGLTGVILWAEIQLKPIRSPFIDEEIIKFRSLDEFFDIARASEAGYEHTVAWIDCFASGKSLGKGLFMRGNHANPPLNGSPKIPAGLRITVPLDAPNFLLNNLSMRAFNTLYYGQQFGRVKRKRVHYEPFFYPLDAVGHWNRIYGRRGFMQYQFVVPYDDDYRAIRTILTKIAASGLNPFLNVFKTFGDVPSPGMLSFPRKGVTLAIDFPNQGQPTFDLQEEIDRIVRDNGGAVYPAKDARMSAESFQAFYPQWEAFSRYVDPHFSSSFWRRVTGE
ncbi:MAG: FAD-binding oxidoreductase [Caldilineae bacterium]|nr:MAG: FAD-binding oxidoreductase [Caldilineae bacterium]